MCMANTISSSQKPLPRATIARFDNPPPCLKSFSKVFPESHDPFGLHSYSDFLFQPWANPMYFCETCRLFWQNPAHYASQTEICRPVCLFYTNNLRCKFDKSA